MVPWTKWMNEWYKREFPRSFPQNLPFFVNTFWISLDIMLEFSNNTLFARGNSQRAIYFLFRIKLRERHNILYTLIFLRSILYRLSSRTQSARWCLTWKIHKCYSGSFSPHSLVLKARWRWFCWVVESASSFPNFAHFYLWRRSNAVHTWFRN